MPLQLPMPLAEVLQGMPSCYLPATQKMAGRRQGSSQLWQCWTGAISAIRFVLLHCPSLHVHKYTVFAGDSNSDFGIGEVGEQLLNMQLCNLNTGHAASRGATKHALLAHACKLNMQLLQVTASAALTVVEWRHNCSTPIVQPERCPCS